MRVEELIDQARFAYPGLPQQCHHLPLASPGSCQGLVQRLQFGLPPHKRRQPTRDGDL